MKSVGIVGAGIIGRLLALSFLKKGWQVTVFDRESLDGEKSCSYVAAGMLCPLAEFETCEKIIFDLGMASMALWEPLLKSLNQPIYFKQQGSLLLSHRDDFPELAHIEERLIKRGAGALIKRIEGSELLALEPGLSHWKTPGLYLSSEGQLDNGQLLQVLQSTLIEGGVSWKANTIVELIEVGCIVSEKNTYNFDLVCDCRGLSARKTFPDLRGVRGELIHLFAPDVTLSRPVRLIHPRYRLYIVPRPNHYYVVGASEIESEDLSPISVRTTLELLSASYSVDPGFSEARLVETQTHCRPAFPDNLPRLYYQEGLLAINGLYRHGYLLAPAVIEEAMRLVEAGAGSLLFPQLWREHSHDFC